ncbi:MAG TPA: hypothetical protein PK939_02585 [Bacteroidales bacterium]|nr:hypothetical protein [Bacteroidales bacterium]HQQ12060.1 hypothetical protein [Bacteroidales bacterium]
MNIGELGNLEGFILAKLQGLLIGLRPGNGGSKHDNNNCYQSGGNGVFLHITVYKNDKTIH